MGLKIFDTLYIQASEDIKEVDTLLKDFKKSDYDSELASITNDLILNALSMLGTFYFL